MKTITTPKGKVIVDESAEIKEGWIVTRNNRVGKFEKTDGKELLIGNKGLVIATINHSISLDVPMVIVEDEIEKSFLITHPNPPSNFKSSIGYREFELGYKADKQKGVYSEEQLRKAFQCGQQWVHDVNHDIEPETLNQLIQSLNQETIELEMEEVYEGETLASASGFALKTKPVRTIKTTRVDGQLMAYLKQANPA